jgi:hypothetical protein
MADSRLVRCTVCLLLALFAETATGATRGIWMTQAQVQALPMSGTAWNNLNNAANGSWGTPDMANQDTKHGVMVLAGALVYARTGNAAMRAKVRDGILAGKRTHDQVAEFGRTLSFGRQLGGYVIAADLIDLQAFDPAADAEFRPWVDSMRTTVLPLSNSRWPTLVRTHENSANNWGTWAGASRIAADLYLGDTADLARAANVFRAWLGERSYYPSGLPWGKYFEPTSSWSTLGVTWSCDPSHWVAINPPCTLAGVDTLGIAFTLDVNGTIVEDIHRGGALSLTPGSDGYMYSWEVLAGVYAQAEMLYRAGYPDVYNWSNKALMRAMDFMVRMGWHMSSPSGYVPWVANRRYGTSYPTTSPFGLGRLVSWTDWTHGSGAPAPDVVPPAAISDLGP